MCLSIPAQVLEVENDLAEVESMGVRVKVSVSLLEGVAVGDYVLVHAGHAIAKIDPVEAEETLKLWEEINATG